MTLKTIEQIYKDIAEDERIAPQVRLNAATQWRELLEAMPNNPQAAQWEIAQLREVLALERERHRCEIEGYKNEIERLDGELNELRTELAETTAELKQARETSRIQNCYLQDTQAALEKEREDRDAYKMMAMRMNAPLIERKREIEDLRREIQAVRMAWGETTAELEHCRELLKASRASTVAVCEMANARDTELVENEAALIALIRRIEAEHAKGGDISIYFRRHYGHRSVQVIGDMEYMGDSLTQIALEVGDEN